MSGELPRPGDIVLYPVSPKSGLASRLVAVGELLWGKGSGNELYSHAAIWEYDQHTLEARWPKTGRYLLDKERPYEVWRVKGITEAQRRVILAWAWGHLNEWYDLPALLFGWVQVKHTEVCSSFVAHAYASAGIHFAPRARLVTPNHLADPKKCDFIYQHRGGRHAT